MNGQLLMKREISEFKHTPVPEGYKKFTYTRGGNEKMSEGQYIQGWFDVCPDWKLQTFYDFYIDKRIPDDGFFLILDKDNKVVAHSNVQLNEYKEGTATVHWVEVSANHKGKRLGYVASEMVLDYVDKHNIKETYLTTNDWRIPAIKIYLNLGFKPVFWKYPQEMKERWTKILKELGYSEIEIYDENENKTKLHF